MQYNIACITWLLNGGLISYNSTDGKISAIAFSQLLIIIEIVDIGI